MNDLTAITCVSQLLDELPKLATRLTMTANPQNTVEILDSISAQSFKTDADRYEAKEAAKRLLARLETPFERSWALSFENPVLIAGLQLCQDLGIWSKWVAKQGSEGDTQSLDDILKMCAVPVQPNLLRELDAPCHHAG